MAGHDGWRWQGRQYHQWFGHGTRPQDGGESEVGTLADRIRSLGHTVIASLPPAKRSHRNATFDEPSRGRFAEAMQVWVDTRTSIQAALCEAGFKGIKEIHS